MTPEDIVRAFIAAWNRTDMEAMLALLAEDVVYHNIPLEPLHGKAAVRAFCEGFGRLDSADWVLHHMAANGPVVMTERSDRMVINGKPLDLPVMGVFEIRDGRIAAWRDYFDLATMTRQLAG